MLAFAGCAIGPSTPSFVVLPGQGKDAAAFQQDDLICRQHAVAGTGYAGPQATQPVAAPAALDPGNQMAYAQCMASRGDTVQARPPLYAATPYPYGFGYPEPFPADPFLAGGLYAGFGFGGWHDHDDHDWHHREGWHGGGWHHDGGGHHGGIAPAHAAHGGPLHRGDRR